MLEPISVYFHGVCGPENPGGYGGWAYILKIDDEIVGRKSGLLGRAPANTDITVECYALVQAMESLFKDNRQGQHVRFYGSKQMLINQFNGIWDIDPAQAETLTIVQNKIRKFRDIAFTYISKRQNAECIALAKEQMKTQGITSRIQPA